MKKMLIIILVLALGGAGAYYFVKTRTPEELTAQSILALFFEQEYNGYSEGTIEVKKYVYSSKEEAEASPRANEETEARLQVQADSNTRYYHGELSVFKKIKDDGTASTHQEAPKLWVEANGESSEMYWWQDNKWVKEYNTREEEISAISDSSVEEVFADATFTEDEETYTITGTATYAEIKNFFKLPKDNIRGLVLYDLFENNSAVVYNMRLNKETYDLLSFELESDNTTMIKIAFEKFNEEIVFSLPVDIEEQTQEEAEQPQYEHAALPGNSLDYKPQKSDLSNDWTNMEFRLDGITHRLGEQLGQLSITGWEITNEGLDFLTSIEKNETIERLTLKNPDCPYISVVVSAKNKSAGIGTLSSCMITSIMLAPNTHESAAQSVKVSGLGGLYDSNEKILELYGNPNYTLNFNADGSYVYEYHSGSLQLKFTFKNKEVNTIQLREK